MEANHAHRRYGKECQCGPQCFSISVPSAREDAPLSVGIEALPSVQAAVGRGRQDVAGLCAAGSSINFNFLLKNNTPLFSSFLTESLSVRIVVAWIHLIDLQLWLRKN
jgi:hypothetical protein